METTKTERKLGNYHCERCGASGAGLHYVQTWAHDPLLGWQRISRSVPRLLCLHCRQYFDVVASWAEKGEEPWNELLELIDRHKAEGRLWFDSRRNMWRPR